MANGASVAVPDPSARGTRGAGGITATSPCSSRCLGAAMSGRPFGTLRERLRDTVREVAATAQTALGNLDTGALVSSTALPTPPRQTDARSLSPDEVHL